MIDDQDRSNLIKYRLDQSMETVELAKFLFDSGQLTTAVNRIYYGIFYAITALAIKYSFETSKHGQLMDGSIKNLLQQTSWIKDLVEF